MSWFLAVPHLNIQRERKGRGGTGVSLGEENRTNFMSALMLHVDGNEIVMWGVGVEIELKGILMVI